MLSARTPAPPASLPPSLVSRSPGKERDSETGLDYFGARYYGSNAGRWMSPDWAGAPEPVPFADFSDPQTLNLYGYVRNNPLGKADVDGHDWDDFVRTVGGIVNAVNQANGFNSPQPLPENQLGRTVGTTIAAVQGTVEVIGGATMTAVGATEALATSPAAGTVAGAAIPATGVATAAAGLLVSGHGSVALGTSLNMMKEGSAGGEGAGKRATPQQRQKALEESGGKCAVPGCNRPADTVDHAVSRKNNGDTTPANLQGMCKHHNCQKGAKDSREFKKWRKDHPEKK